MVIYKNGDSWYIIIICCLERGGKMQRNIPKMHPTIKRCLTHLEVLGTDDKTKQIVYMYLQTLFKELSLSHKHSNDH